MDITNNTQEHCDTFAGSYLAFGLQQEHSGKL